MNNMWKIALAVMLLATTAFGGVSLTVNGQAQNANVNLVNGVATVTIALANDTNSGIAGIDVLPYMMDASQTNMLDLVRVSSRQLAAGSPFVWGVPPTSPDDKLGVPLDATVNYGLTYSDATNGSKYNGDIMTLTFVPAPGVEITRENPAVVTMYMGYAFGAATGGGDFAFPTVTITPEPASMLLLAAGMAFFARRRRA